MGKEQKITLTKSELKRAMVLEKWIDGRLTEQDVARTLGISIRQAYRLNGPLSIDWTHGIEKITQHNRTFVRIEWV